MFKCISVFAALSILAASPASAQHEAILKRIEVPGANFDLVLAMPKMRDGHSVNLIELRDDPDPSVLYFAEGRLVHAFDADVEAMFKDIRALQSPSCIFHPNSESHSPQTIAVYVVLK